MSDPWQDDADVEDDWEEELTGPAGRNPLDPEELGADDDDADLWDADDLDGDAA
ncbi:MAG TPA: hypothetical protein VFK76_05650 [Gaiellaceae bacterium]|nr:hypothetical protein [Gaiellaceae bacterium]